MTAHSLMFGPADIARAVQEGRDAERHRILTIINNRDWSGDDLEEDITNLTNLIEGDNS